MKNINVGTIGHIDHGHNNLKSLVSIVMDKLKVEHKMKLLKSKVDYFDIKVGDDVEVLSFHPVSEQTESKDGSVEQHLDYYKVVLPNTTKVHYLFTFETEEV